MERQARDGTVYKQVGEDQWQPVTRMAKDGTVYKKMGADAWSPISESPKTADKTEAKGNLTSDAAETTIMQGLHGATAGFLDEASGAVEAAGRVIGVKGAGGSFSDLGLADEGPTVDWETLRDAYRKARDNKRDVLKTQSEERPVLAGGAQLAGAIFSPANKLVKGASMVNGGAVLGGVHGLGASDAEDTSGMLRDTATGALLGAASGKGLEAGGKILKSSANAVQSAARRGADRFAARALGAERGTVKSLGSDEVERIGRYALDERILSPLASTDDLLARNAAKQEQGGKLMQRAYDAIDDAGRSKFNPQQAASEVDSQLGGFWRSPLNRGETKQFENTLETILMRGEGNIPIKEAQALKEQLGKAANWKNNINITDKERIARDAYGIVSKQIDNAVAEGSKEIGDESLLRVLREGKSLFGKSKGAEKLLENKQAREQGNRFFSLTDQIIGAPGLVGAIPTSGASVLVSAAAIGAKKLAERYGAQNAALALNRLSKGLAAQPKIAAFAAKRPEVFQAVVARLGTEGVVSRPRVAESERNQPPPLELKGEKKWALNGLGNLFEHDSSVLEDDASLERILSSKKGRDLLSQASDLKPQSKAMDKLVQKIRSSYSEGGR